MFCPCWKRNSFEMNLVFNVGGHCIALTNMRPLAVIYTCIGSLEIWKLKYYIFVGRETWEVNKWFLFVFIHKKGLNDGFVEKCGMHVFYVFGRGLGSAPFENEIGYNLAMMKYTQITNPMQNNCRWFSLLMCSSRLYVTNINIIHWVCNKHWEKANKTN